MNLSFGAGTLKSIINQLMAKSIMTSQKKQKTSMTAKSINGETLIENMALAGRDKKAPRRSKVRFSRGKKY